MQNYNNYFIFQMQRHKKWMNIMFRFGYLARCQSFNYFAHPKKHYGTLALYSMRTPVLR